MLNPFIKFFDRNPHSKGSTEGQKLKFTDNTVKYIKNEVSGVDNFVLGYFNWNPDHQWSIKDRVLNTLILFNIYIASST